MKKQICSNRNPAEAPGCDDGTRQPAAKPIHFWRFQIFFPGASFCGSMSFPVMSGSFSYFP
jgi:hypothetical protein